ncbi:MAG TPA: DNA repair protein RecO [Gemmatimonadales bacterium]|nr:DNA repair protein RecO [Gemmatimonadales bacterium]
MPLVTTRAVVLRTHRYSESSKIVRLATRDIGVQSAIAKGALRPHSRFGAAIEFLSEGDVQIYYKESRDLHTLGAFDVANLRRGLASDLERFTAAAAVAEVMLKMAPPAPLPTAFDTLTAVLDMLVSVAPEAQTAAGVRGLWVLVRELGFGPALSTCVRDDAAIVADGVPIAFSAAEGGVLCPHCAPSRPPTRLPPEDYHVLLALNDPQADLPVLDAPHAAAHRRLVARFIRYHLETESLAALDSWERHEWSSPPPEGEGARG